MLTICSARIKKQNGSVAIHNRYPSQIEQQPNKIITLLTEKHIPFFEKIKVPNEVINNSKLMFHMINLFQFITDLTILCSEAVVQRCSVQKVSLEISQNSQENTCEFCEISKNTFFNRTPLVAASACYKKYTSHCRQRRVNLKLGSSSFRIQEAFTA